MAGGGDPLEGVLLGEVDDCGRVESAEDGEAKSGAHGAAEGFGREGVRGADEADDAVSAGGFCGAEDGAEVAGVLDAVEQDKQGVVGKGLPEGLGGELGALC